ncbi:MAG TPA: hypothetical protein VL306_00560 [Methylomirabilota bacterium]|jgi:hypothetical protein|nr:hypothetical protein [Methylomirabilota bacterium]
MQKKLDGEIIRMNVPDEEVPSWLQTLQETGFSQEEIDKIMSNLNTEYARALGKERLSARQSELKAYAENKLGRKLTDEEFRGIDMAVRAFFGDFGPSEDE